MLSGLINTAKHTVRTCPESAMS